jgi:type II secretory pathway pseudopilin PulG
MSLQRTHIFHRPTLMRRERRAPMVQAFTLVEVILAIGIAAGLLVVAISFYQRSAELRNQLLEESAKLSTVRLLMDRLSGDLRTAFAEPRQGFSGSGEHMTFVHAGSPTAMNISEGALKLVTYGVVTNTEGTNTTVIGFDRTEQPLIEMRSISTTTATNEVLSFNGAMDPTQTTNVVVEPLTRSIRYVQFRYFDGAQWRDIWDGVDLPVGVEVTFGFEPLPAEEDEIFESVYPYEVFRRVIYLPGGRAVADPDSYLFPSGPAATSSEARSSAGASL